MGPAVAFHPSRVTTDTQLLAYPKSRRFLMALWELAGETLKVTPTVAKELMHIVEHAETRRWQKIINRDYSQRNFRYDESTFHDILNRTSRAASDWIRNELETEGTSIATATGTSDAILRADHLSEQFPAECFLPSYDSRHLNDRLIIAQAVTLNYKLLATENLDTIDHYRVNAWLEAQGHTKGPLIVQIRDAMPSPSNRKHPGEASLAAALGASLPRVDQGPKRDIQLLDQFLGDACKNACICRRRTCPPGPPPDT